MMPVSYDKFLICRIVKSGQIKPSAVNLNFVLHQRNTMINFDPVPSVLFAQICPLCLSIIFFVMASPIPEPSYLSFVLRR